MGVFGCCVIAGVSKPQFANGCRRVHYFNKFHISNRRPSDKGAAHRGLFAGCKCLKAEPFPRVKIRAIGGGMVGNGARKTICQRYTRPKRAAPFGAIDKKAAGTGCRWIDD